MDSTFLNTVNTGIAAGVSDELIGGGGKDLPSGGNDNDELTGGIGQDSLHCGAGKDKITDFKPIEGDIESTNCE